MGAERRFCGMPGINIVDIDKSALVDANTVLLEEALPKAQRMENDLRQIKTPSCFRCGDTGISVVFTPGAPFLQEILTRYCIEKINE